MRNVVPNGTSMSPVRRTLPTRAKVLVPFEASVPWDAYHSAPPPMMAGSVASVSTLSMIVGRPHRPETAGYGGRVRGMPRRPSMLAIRAVSSPQTKAPAPSLSVMSNEKSEPRMCSPSRPSLLMAAMAERRRRTASGYSALM